MIPSPTRKSYPFKPAAAAFLVFLSIAWGIFLLNKPARFRPDVPAGPLPSRSSMAGPTAAAPGGAAAGRGSADGREARAQAAGVRLAEQLFWRGALFSELNPRLWAESYPAVYREVQADPDYAARFGQAARARESDLVRATLGDPPLVMDEANRAVLSAQVVGPVGRAIQQGLREPDSYRCDAQDQSRPRPYYHQGRWCWKVDRFWYHSRNTFGLYVKDCVAAVVAKDDPFHEYKVLTLQEAAF